MSFCSPRYSVPAPIDLDRVPNQGQLDNQRPLLRSVQTSTVIVLTATKGAKRAVVVSLYSLEATEQTERFSNADGLKCHRSIRITNQNLVEVLETFGKGALHASTSGCIVSACRQ